MTDCTVALVAFCAGIVVGGWGSLLFARFLLRH